MKYAFFLVLLFTASLVIAQSESDHYNSPKDTLIFSKALDEQREISIILPKSLNKSNAKYPLIIIFDRQNRGIFRQLYESLNYSVAMNAMPESIIIGLSSKSNKRYLETSFLPSTESARGEKLTQFVFSELIPWAKTNFRTNNINIIIGHSRFGYFTSYSLLKHSADLTGVISFSPFFKQPEVNVIDSIAKQVNTFTLKHTLYYRFVTGDSITDTKEYLDMKRKLQISAIPPKFNWKGLDYYDANHFLTPGIAIIQCFNEIFYYWENEAQKLIKTFSAIEYEGFKNRMSDHYGDKIGLGISRLNGLGHGFNQAEQPKLARLTWNTLIKEYPSFTEAYLSIANSYIKEGNFVQANKYLEDAKNSLIENTLLTMDHQTQLHKEIEKMQK